MRKLMIGGTVVLLALAGQPSERGTDVDGEAWRLKHLALGEGDERVTAVLTLEAMARQYRRQAEETPPVIDGLGRNFHERDISRCWRILQVLREIGARHSLLLFEEMTGSTERNIREDGIRGYISVAELADLLPFIDRLMKNPRCTVYERTPAYLNLRQRMEASPQPEDMEKICAFILEKTFIEEGGVTAELDKILCSYLLGYSTSVQRQNLAERMSDFGIGTRAYFDNAKQEIEKTPVNERKDFRAKGELLDPERQPR